MNSAKRFGIMLFGFISFILLLGVSISDVIITKKYLRGLPEESMNIKFKEEIKRIIETVKEYATFSLTSYTEDICNGYKSEYTSSRTSLLSNFEENHVREKLNSILVDSEILISQTKLCKVCLQNSNGDEERNGLLNCKQLTINW